MSALSDLEPDARLLEVGTGMGAMGARLAQRHEYLGVELDATSAAVAVERVQAVRPGADVLGADADLPDGAFDAVCAFEVLEHIEDDLAAATEWCGRLRPGGTLVISVPADQKRMGPADHAVGHFRRYDEEHLTQVLTGAGFEHVEVRRVGFPLGYVLENVRNRLLRGRGSMEDRTRTSGRVLQPPRWVGPLVALALVPFRLLQKPFGRTRLGTNLVATARRPA